MEDRVELTPPGVDDWMSRSGYSAIRHQMGQYERNLGSIWEFYECKYTKRYYPLQTGDEYDKRVRRMNSSGL